MFSLLFNKSPDLEKLGVFGYYLCLANMYQNVLGCSLATQQASLHHKTVPLLVTLSPEPTCL